MFVRVKQTTNSPRESVQIVQSVRKGSTISQKIVRHIGVAYDDDGLEVITQVVRFTVVGFMGSRFRVKLMRERFDSDLIAL